MKKKIKNKYYSKEILPKLLNETKKPISLKKTKNPVLFSRNYLSFLKKKLKDTKLKSTKSKTTKSKTTKLPEKHAAGYYLTKSIDNIRPLLDLQRVRRKGRTYYIPHEIRKEKARTQAIKWLKEGSVRSSKGKNQSIAQALATLLLESLQGVGYGQKKQKEHHTLAITNRSYIRFRWW